MLIDRLRSLGLTEGEAKVYEALVALGQSKVGPIVKRSGVAYSNVYDVIMRLQEKGLVTYITREKTKLFNAVPPHRLTEYLEKKEEEIRESQKMLTSIIPALTSLQAAQQDPTDAEVFSGTKGLRTAYDVLYYDCLKGNEALYFYVYEKKHETAMFEFYRREWPKIKRLGITARGLVQEEYRKTMFAKNIPSFFKERFVSFPLPGTIDIVGDRILVVVWGDKPIGILIHSRQVAQNFREYFESVWKIAKK